MRAQIVAALLILTAEQANSDEAKWILERPCGEAILLLGGATYPGARAELAIVKAYVFGVFNGLAAGVIPYENTVELEGALREQCVRTPNLSLTEVGILVASYGPDGTATMRRTD